MIGKERKEQILAIYYNFVCKIGSGCDLVGSIVSAGLYDVINWIFLNVVS